MPAAIVRPPDKTIIRARPDQLRAEGRNANIIDHAATGPWFRRIRRRRRIEGRRDGQGKARQIRADRRPVLAPIACLEEALVAKIEIIAARAENQRQGPGPAIGPREGEGRINRPGLAGLEIKLVHATAEHGLRVLGIGRNLIAFAARRYFAKGAGADPVNICITTFADAGCAGILLRAIHMVGELIIRCDVIELSRRLIEPGTPGLAAVQGYKRALIDAQYPPVRLGRIDPKDVIIIPRGVTFQGDEMGAAVGGLKDNGVIDIDFVGDLRIGCHSGKIPAALDDAPVVGRAPPVCAAIIGPVETALRTIDQSIDAGRISRRGRETNPPGFRRQSVTRQGRPAFSSVRRAIEAASRSAGGGIDIPRRAARLPKGGIDHVRRARLKGEVNRADIL